MAVSAFLLIKGDKMKNYAKEKNLLSQNQRIFEDDACYQGFEVYQYSGRGMFGDTCPAITIDDVSDFKTKAKFKIDNMGKGFVLYAQN